MSNDNSLSPPELGDRIAILQDIIRQLIEQAVPVARPRNATPSVSLSRAEKLDRLTKDRDALLKK